MGDMSKTFSGQAETAAKGTAGQMRNAQIQFGEFQEQIGTALLPVLSSLAGFMVDTLIPAISDVAKFMGDNKEAMIAGFMALAIVVGAIVIPAFITWATAAGAAALATLTAVAPFILIGVAVAAIAFLIMKNWDTIKAATAVVWEFISGLVSSVWDGIKAGVTVVWEWIQTVFGWIVTGVTAAAGFLGTVFTAAWDAIKAVVTTLWDWIQTVFGWIVDGITAYVNIYVTVVTKAWELIKAGVTAVWQWITDRFNAIAAAVQSAVDTLLGFVTRAWDSIKDGASSVWRFVTDKFQAIADFFGGLVGKIGDTARAIVDAIKTPINALISLWNGLAFAIPSIAIPEVDLGPLGKHGGGTLGGFRIDFPDLNYLAKGGVLTSPTLFVGGEAGTEIVAPEDMLRAIVRDESRGGGHYTLNLYPRTADASDIAYGFRRLELLAGLP
jgi:phage-related protein